MVAALVTRWDKYCLIIVNIFPLIVQIDNQPSFVSDQSPIKVPLVQALEPYENLSATPTGHTRPSFRGRRHGRKSTRNENRDSTNDKRMNTSQ